MVKNIPDSLSRNYFGWAVISLAIFKKILINICINKLINLKYEKVYFKSIYTAKKSQPNCKRIFSLIHSNSRFLDNENTQRLRNN